MLAAPRPKPVGETKEVRLIDRVEDLNHRPLKELVLQRADPERPQPPIGLWYERSPRRTRPVCAPVDPSVEIAKVIFEILPVVLPRHPVHPRGGLRVQRPVGRPEAFDVDVVQERGEPHLLVLRCDSAHAIKRAGHTHTGSVSGACCAGHVSLGQPPFLHHLRGRLLGVVRRFRRYYEAVRLPTLVHLGITASAFPERPAH